MRNREAIKQRYLRDNLSVRLGGLAANLARIKSFSDHPDNREAVERLIEESKFFIEWAAPDADIDVQASLVELQIQLVLWHREWREIWNDPQRKPKVAEEAEDWSQRVLQWSGLLP